MPPRTRRSAAVAAAQLVADLQAESDEEKEEEEEEEQVDVEADDDEQDAEDAEEEEEVEVEAGDSQSGGEDEDDDDDVPLEVTPKQPRLKITLKLPANNASSAGTATPDEPELDYAAFKRTPKRRAKAKVIQDVDIESEDPPSASGSEDEQSTAEAPSRSTGTPSASTKPMTTRQAVLASVVDPSHVSLNEGSRSKKQPLNETELALRREETARKRKNLSEKKLEDEKAETINRLLKKQSRPKNKRNNTIDERSPLPSVSGSRTPKLKGKNGEDGEDANDADGDEDMETAMDIVEQPEEVKPVMYRWISSMRSQGDGDETQMRISINFAVPEIALPAVANEAHMPVDDQAEIEKVRAARGPGICAVAGCGKPRKYRLPKDWTIGACDSVHLKVLAN